MIKVRDVSCRTRVFDRRERTSSGVMVAKIALPIAVQ